MNFITPANVQDELQKFLDSMKPMLSTAFTDTVDRKQMWDGSFDPNNWHEVTSHYSHSFKTRSQYIPLTLGGIAVTFTTGIGYRLGASKNNPIVFSIEFTYMLPDFPNYRIKPLFSGSLSRRLTEHNYPKYSVSEQKFRKAVTAKLNDLIKSVNTWYSSKEDRGLQDFIFRYFGKDGGWYAGEYGFGPLKRAVGRVRLISALHTEAATADKVPNYGDRINELATEMLRLITEQQGQKPFTRQVCPE